MCCQHTTCLAGPNAHAIVQHANNMWSGMMWYKNTSHVRAQDRGTVPLLGAWHSPTKPADNRVGLLLWVDVDGWLI